mmetsp:Transcript_30187/g.90508  ORF Transcript_30187/g.90508 Transcript_30187/m.90508 type:complete len:312 (+) Transcript_30187:69-1004(+)
MLRGSPLLDAPFQRERFRRLENHGHARNERPPNVDLILVAVGLDQGVRADQLFLHSVLVEQFGADHTVLGLDRPHHEEGPLLVESGFRRGELMRKPRDIFLEHRHLLLVADAVRPLMVQALFLELLLRRLDVQLFGLDADAEPSECGGPEVVGQPQHGPSVRPRRRDDVGVTVVLEPLPVRRLDRALDPVEQRDGAVDGREVRGGDGVRPLVRRDPVGAVGEQGCQQRRELVKVQLKLSYVVGLLGRFAPQLQALHVQLVETHRLPGTPVDDGGVVPRDIRFDQGVAVHSLQHVRFGLCCLRLDRGLERLE